MQRKTPNSLFRIILFPMTKWHLYGMLAYLLETYDDQIFNRELEVYVTSRGDQGYALEKTDMPYNNLIYKRDSDIAVTNASLFKIALLNKKRSKKEILILCANSLVPRKILSCVSASELIENKLKVIAVDDGVGSYLSSKVWKKMSEGESKTAFRDSIKFRIAHSMNKDFNLSQWHMLTKSDEGSLIPVHTEGYSRVLHHDIERSFKKQIGLFQNKYKGIRKAIIITQPWSETNQISKKEEANIVREIINKIKSRYQIFVKPHPRERQDKYNYPEVITLGREFPAEFYFYAFSSEDIVIGFDSTALVNAALLFNLNTFSLAAQIAQRQEENMMTVACREFCELTSNIINEFK